MSEKEPEMGPLFEALARAQAKVKGAAKGSINPHFKSKYADLESVWEACREAVTSEGLAVAQTFDVMDQQPVLVTILGHKSGAMLTGRYPLTPVKMDPQGLAAAATYARKISLAAMVGVAPADDDGETAQGRGETPAAGTNGNAAPQKAPANPLTTDQRAELVAVAKNAGLITGTDVVNVAPFLALCSKELGRTIKKSGDIETSEFERVRAALEVALEASKDADVDEIFGAATK